MKFNNPYNIFLDDNPLELVFPSNNSYKGSSTKEGSNSKAIAKRRKRNKNKKTYIIEMQNGEIIPALIARIRQNNTDNVVIRSKLYNLLNDVTRKFNEAMIACPHIVDFQNMSNEQVLEHYYLSVGAESLWDSRELIMKAISEQNKLIKEEYDNNNK